jgi:hypothetical protein
MGLLTVIKEFFARIFAKDPEDAKRRMELRRLYALLDEVRPPYYKPKQNLVLPGFATAVHHFCTLLRPLSELARATVANSDARISQRFFDYLIDCRLPSAEQERKRYFSYDGMSERIQKAFRADEELESIAREFQDFLSSLEALGSRTVNADLYEVDRFIDICRHDYERILGLFDPGASLDDPRYQPDFTAVPGEQAVPELVDFYYLLEGFFFSPQLKENVLRLLERRQSGEAVEAKRNKVDKLFDQLDRLVADRLHPDILLALLRAAKGEPFYTPSTPRERRDFLESYRKRLIVQFDKDRERILREQHENAIAADIRSLFGEDEILEVEAYDEDNDSYLRRESPNGFTWVKPLRILKTYIANLFAPQLAESVKRILVEGFFDNKNFQNNMANILYQCERSGARITEFEAQLKGSGRVSIVAMKRYIEEMRRGKDISAFLARLVDAINDKAKEIVEDETGLFVMLGDALGDLLSDYRRSSPDLVTNIRTLGGARNKELMAQIQQGRERISVLVKIMRNFTFVKPGSPGAIGQGNATAAEAGSPVQPGTGSAAALGTSVAPGAEESLPEL